MKRILMIAFHFPPLAHSSAMQRNLGLIKNLPSYGWEPLVLTVQPRAHASVAMASLQQLPKSLVVERAFVLDTSRHLSIAGRYWGAMAIPDRWVSWRLDACRVGLKMIEQYQPDLIWSTYPIATAHQIGAWLHHKSGVPWVAEMQDPMAQPDYPADPKTWQAFKRTEEEIFNHARACVLTTPSAAADYKERYLGSKTRLCVIENGYDEAAFQPLVSSKVPSASNSRRLALLHSGTVYPSERDPRPLFQALSDLLHAGEIDSARLRVIFRASGHDELLNALIKKHALADVVELQPAIPHAQALEEMCAVDGLLLLQASNCNAQIPAKLYEYMRTGKPILALTDPAGDTAHCLRRYGYQQLVPLDAVDEIKQLVRGFVQGPVTDMVVGDRVADASIQARAKELADLLSGVV